MTNFSFLTDEFEQMKILCKVYLSEGEIKQTRNAKELIKELERKGHVGKYNPEPLTLLLENLGRRDLARDVKGMSLSS